MYSRCACVLGPLGVMQHSVAREVASGDERISPEEAAAKPQLAVTTEHRTCLDREAPKLTQTHSEEVLPEARR